jgi:hypothetical protein
VKTYPGEQWVDGWYLGLEKEGVVWVVICEDLYIRAVGGRMVPGVGKDGVVWVVIFEDLSIRAVGGWMAPGAGKDGGVWEGI